MDTKQHIILILIYCSLISGCGSSHPNSYSATPLPTALPIEATPQPTKAYKVRVSLVDDMHMVFVPMGDFIMGSMEGDIDEKPVRTVFLSSFWIDQTEVTQAMYAKCSAEGCTKPTCKSGGDNYPIVCVDWASAKAYCEWAGRRLPDEFEWEKAARGTEGSLYPWGNEKATCEYAVMDEGNGNGCGKGDSAWEVGSKPAGISPYGALDMAGNVWEWVEDWDYYAVNGAGRVLRGGGFFSIASTVRSAKREVLHRPIDRNKSLGFRCAMDGYVTQ
jgi:formylglycine-generating enzyme required for sulfatase activity